MNSKTFGKNNKELSALIGKKFKNLSRTFQRNADFWWQEQKSISSLAESVEKGEISSPSSEWKLGLDELFVTCDSKNKLEKPTKYYLDLFINTSLNYLSIKFRLVS